MYKRYLFIVLLLIVACGGGEETAISTPATSPTPVTPTATSTTPPPDPTATPSPQPTETAVPTPTTNPVSFSAPYIDELYRYRIATLTGYQYQLNPDDSIVEFSPIDDADMAPFQYQTAGGIITKTQDDIWEIVQRLLAGEDLGTEINEIFGPGTREVIQVAGAEGISIQTQFEDDDVMMMSKTAVVATDLQWFLLNSTMPASDWNDNGAQFHAALLSSVELLPPLADDEVILGDLVSPPIGDYTIAILLGYEIEQTERAAFFTSINNEDETAFRYVLAAGDMSALLESQQTEFEQCLQGEDTWTGGEIVEQAHTEMFGMPGVTSILHTSEGGIDYTWRLILVTNGEQYLMFYGGIESSRWEVEGQATVATLLPSIQKYQPESVSDLTVSFGDPIISVSGGYQIASILDYEIDQDNDGFTAVSPPPHADNNDFLYVLWGGLMDDLGEEDRAFIETLMVGENTWLGYEMRQIESFSLLGLNGITAEISATENGQPFKGRIVALANEQQWFVFSGGIEASRWDNNEGRHIFEHLLNTLILFPPLPNQDSP